DGAVDEGHRRGVEQVDAQPAVELVHLDVEIRVKLARGARIVRGASGGQHRQGAAAQELVHAAGGGVAEARDFLAREHVEAAAREDAGVDGRELVGLRVFHGSSIWAFRGLERTTAGSPRPSLPALERWIRTRNAG